MENIDNNDGELPDTSVQVTEGSEETDESKYQCKHYKRKCQFVTPCCDNLYRCRFCHDEEQDHTLKRDDVKEIECSNCGLRQPVQQSCPQCGTVFGKYFCYECKLYDDEDKQQFHCDGCGICRVGGRSKYFHCDKCDMCLPNHLKNAHKCVEKVSRSNCPVCQEDIHTSRIPSQIPPCNHLIHKTCFDEMISNGHYACPICGVSMMNMTDVWKIYDKEISETPMPEEYQDLHANIQCRDCLKTSLTIFHILGLKCGECGGYNTVRDKGPLVRKVSGLSPSLTPPLSPVSQSASHSAGPVTEVFDPPGAESSVTMTPEASPVRLELDQDLDRGLSVSLVARRLDFEDQMEQ